ncbi:tetratricopeptide repeat protein [Desulfosporosinus hippei]|uniref:Tetratricopeptide repeat-containing protein n=1 Tax=Desulfosporosinus hippei DSM 8344 TaxID=1121419 RepID=A0A1G7X6U0_9FIRM|nr:hypothetical protein [Desulfosporosinus hippei]SDG79853.1 Tetratricopeptide repeat-containing protein [Desulfosporosinus hippei DSM 8344]
MNKRSQRIFAGILAVLVSLAMVGSAFIGYFFDQTPSANPANNATANLEAKYQSQKASIAAMVEQEKSTPENIPLLTALGNEYYNAGMTAQMVAPTEVQENFKKAVEVYQKVLQTNKDPNIIVDMATSAFYSGDYELAEKSYNEALTIKPDFMTAMINYGIFLSQAKQDWTGAINYWQKALPLAQNSTDKEQIEAMISQAQSQLGTNQTNDGLSNPNLKNGE